MTSHSARVSSECPFYARHAEAYDALIVEPIDAWVDAVHSHLQSVGVPTGALLDAGCGTGRHAQGLIRRGHRVELLDASADLLAIARRRCPDAAIHRGDLCTFTLPHLVDAVLCRGVLNDLLTDTERDGALRSFAGLLHHHGTLFLDVRESRASEDKSDGRLRRTETELESGSRLTFTSTPTWRDGFIEVQETYELEQLDGHRVTSDYSFHMRPWTVPELQHRLIDAGFDEVRIAPGHGGRAADRLFVVARRAAG